MTHSEKPKTIVEKRTHTVVDTIMITPALVKTWQLPVIQRSAKVNDKVRALSVQLKSNGGVLPGIITLGIVDGTTYIVDGQHRLVAFTLSGIKEGYTDVRKVFASSVSDLGAEYVVLNSKLVTHRPDDVLRALEDSVEALSRIREECPFVGYDMVRRNNTNAPIVSMAATLRCWRGSSSEVPSMNGSGLSAEGLARTIVPEETRALIAFLKVAHVAFGRDVEYARLWAGLNMIMCMWLYRRLVLTQHSPKTVRIDDDLFRKCLMSLSAESSYLDWLVGRKLCEHDRSPAYNKIKMVFSQRLRLEMGKKVMLPAPAWVSH